MKSLLYLLQPPFELVWILRSVPPPQRFPVRFLLERPYMSRWMR
jgi:hypothetical protein